MTTMINPDHRATSAIQLDLGSLLPPESIECQPCLARFESMLRRVTGIKRVDLASHPSVATVHYDPDQISQQRISTIAAEEGSRLGTQFAHRVVPIEGMDCSDCAMTLERGIGNLPGVEWANVNFAGARMAVEYDAGETDMDAIARRVSSLGYEVADQTESSSDHPLKTFITTGRTLRTLIAAVLAITGGAIHLSSAPVTVATALYVAAILIAGVPIARKAINSALATRQLDINMLMTIAVIGAGILGEWVEAAAVVVLFSLGEALEGYTMARARSSIRTLMSLTPAEAVVRRGTAEQTIPVSEIVPGDIVVVRPGDRLPVDGIVTNGRSAVNQAPVTGESVPVDKSTGATVFSGTVNGGGALEIRASRPASDSTIARIIRMVEDAQAQRAPSQRFVDVFAKYYTPAVVVLAAGIAVAPPLLTGAEWSNWIYRALVLLVIACPCALVISTPVSIVSAISAAARNGVLIKGGAYLEAAGSLRALAFDKTGTLTRGKPAVLTITPVGETSETELLRTAAAAERYSEHPLGEAIASEAARRGIDLRDIVPERTEIHPGRGIETMIEGALIKVGTPEFVQFRVTDEGTRNALNTIEEQGQTAVLVAAEDRVLGVIGLADEVRPGSSEALQQIREAGIENTVMLTGDRKSVGQAIGARLGIDTVKAELLPEHKVQAIEELSKQYGRVGMVGDGVNDAPALARSDVGFAMGAAGSDTALETADIALMSDDISKVGFTIRLSKAAKRIIMQNIGLSLAIKVVFLVLAVGGTATLWQAIFADVGAALIVIVNGMRLLRE
jgi:Zn2+/Cd2+-exporting ATPase